jgi:hypothetical protein
MIDGLVEPRTDKELDLINHLFNAVLHAVERDTVILLLKSAVASINKTESR